MADKKFDLGDYVEVKDRIALLYELYPQARLVTRRIEVMTLEDGQYIVVHALAYRTPDDPLPGTGTSWLKVPGSTSYTKGSEVENAETSAWGRAIGSLGILIDRSIASAQEVQNKQGQTPVKPTARTPEDDQRMAGHDPGGMVGIIEEAKDSPDFLPHVGPEGYVLTFKLKGDGRSGGIKAIATGPLAEQLADAKDDVLGARVTAWGRVRDESYDNKAGRTITYQVLDLERISTPVGTFPIVISRPAAEEEQPPAIPVAEGQVPAFDLAESARIDAEEAAV